MYMQYGIIKNSDLNYLINVCGKGQLKNNQSNNI